jgi:gas vesicle protein
LHPPAAGAASVRSEAQREAAMKRANAEELDVDWMQVGTFSAGVAVGALLGAAAALLLAPHSGAATRRAIGRRARFLREDARDAWDDLGDGLRDARREAQRAIKRKRRGLRRKLERRRWALADAVAGDRPDAC